ncbi:hypothetical protein [Lachnospira multipara]|uniref:hypothetical protein n=1 Tax=Lachnospira multipara TaxID=28051 RepID=UPI000481B471|nr:hypothetical protein [Lachnospira multipara]
MFYPEISSRELIEKFDSDDFYKVYGNPVKCKIFDTDRILMSSDLYERLFGKVDLDKENTIEMDDFIRALVLQRLYENPVSVTDTEDGYSLSMESEVYDFLNRNTLKDFGITLENLTSYFFERIVACPDEFKAWVEESMIDKGAENDNK